MNDTRRRRMLICLVLLSGFLAGAAAPELFRMGTGDYTGLASRYSFQKYQGSTVSVGKVLPYILSLRLKTLLILWMSSFTAAGLLLHLAYAWWLAASAGLLLSLFLLREGYEGFLLFSCCLLPQWILYAAMWKGEGELLWRRIRGGETGKIYSGKPGADEYGATYHGGMGTDEYGATYHGETGADGIGAIYRRELETDGVVHSGDASADEPGILYQGRAGGAGTLYPGELSALLRITAICVLGCIVEAFLGRWTLRLFLEIFL